MCQRRSMLNAFTCKISLFSTIPLWLLTKRLRISLKLPKKRVNDGLMKCSLLLAICAGGAQEFSSSG